jgi:UPF0755 protein
MSRDTNRDISRDISRGPRRKTQSTESDWQEDDWDGPEAWRMSEFEAQPDDRRPDSRTVLIALAVVMSVVLSVGVTGMWYLRQINPPDLATNGKPVATNFTVNSNDSLISVSARLEKEGFIVNAGVFRWYAQRKGGIDLQPGYFALIKHEHIGNIMKKLNKSPSITFTKVTFPEGFTVTQIAKRIEDKTTRITAQNFFDAMNNPLLGSVYFPTNIDFLAAAPFRLEGLLFPDTYQVSGDETASSVVDRMLRLMERVGNQEGLSDSQEKVGRSPYEVLIIASIIEREAKLEVDRGKISRVIYNRLERGMPLQIDATLYYNSGEGASFTDLKAVDSPYNSYIYKGLPPTPIASPGRAAIRAALNPSPNPDLNDKICIGIKKSSNCVYLYYVLSDANGGHTFAATEQDHGLNVEVSRAAGYLP